MSFYEEVELSSDMIQQNLSDQEDEIVALESIYPDEFFIDSELLTESMGDNMESPGGRAGRCMSLLININLGSSGARIIVPTIQATDHDRFVAAASAKLAAMTMEMGQSATYEKLAAATGNGVSAPALTYDVEFLPPIRLRWRCPPEYPSHAAPAYTLSCPWLGPAALAAACVEIDRIAESSAGLHALKPRHAIKRQYHCRLQQLDTHF